VLARLTDPEQRNHETPSETGAPALRSGGFSLARQQRAETLLELLKDHRDLNDDLEQNTLAVLHADDLIRYITGVEALLRWHHPRVGLQLPQTIAFAFESFKEYDDPRPARHAAWLLVSHDGGIGDWPADERLEMRAPEKPVGVGGVSRVELWIVPADARGAWASQIPGHGGAWRFHVRQKYQELDIDLEAQGRDLLVRNSRLRGTEIKMVVTGIVGARAWNHLFEGHIDGDRIGGRLSVSDGNQIRTYPWKATRQ